MIKWPWRSNRQHSKVLGEFDVEETFHIISYILEESRMKLIVHLPSMRVSESHYDEFGNLIKYCHNSVRSAEHISNICKQDPSLQEYISIATAKAGVKTMAKPKSRRTMYLIMASIVWIVWIVFTIYHSYITM